VREWQRHVLVDARPQHRVAVPRAVTEQHVLGYDRIIIIIINIIIIIIQTRSPPLSIIRAQPLVKRLNSTIIPPSTRAIPSQQGVYETVGAHREVLS
jgi:hypothetical protein